MKLTLNESTRLILARAFGDNLPARTLVVFSTAGLNNRIRVLASGLALAEATGRAFAMLWPRSPNCGAPFDMLFQNRWPVVNLPTVPAELRSFHAVLWSDKRLRWFLKNPQQHIIVRYYTWLVGAQVKTAFVSLQQRCASLAAELQPTAMIASRVETFRARHFSPAMIGVHLRRGDFSRGLSRYSQNTSPALKAVDHFLEIKPQAGIFLCTDDGAVDPTTGQPTVTEGVQATFEKRYGKRVIWSTPRSLDPQVPEAVQDAVTDLWLLRATDYFVGTFNSSFSGMAVVGRSIPHIFCAAVTPIDEYLEKIINSIGLGSLLRFAVRRRFGKELPFPLAWRWFIRLPLAPARILRRLINELRQQK